MNDLKITIKNVLECIGDPEYSERKMLFNDLANLQGQLYLDLVEQAIDIEQYDRDLDDILLASGWSIEEYADEIDKRWDKIDDIIPLSDLYCDKN